MPVYSIYGLRLRTNQAIPGLSATGVAGRVATAPPVVGGIVGGPTR